MANLPETPDWIDGIYQLETNDPGLGGAPNLSLGQGFMNVQPQQLAQRTGWLKAQIERIDTPVATAIASDLALDAIVKSGIVTVAQGALNPPLSMGALVTHTEIADGSARQDAYRITPAGVFLGLHARLRRTGTWTAWAPIGAPVGDIAMQAGPTIGPDRLEATGALVSRATYADLFAAIGVTYGTGDGSTTFALPDLRGEFIRGLDQGRGADPGRVLGSSQADEIASHDHDLKGWRSDFVDSTGGRFPVLADAAGDRMDSDDGMVAFGGDETRPRNVALLFTIKI